MKGFNVIINFTEDLLGTAPLDREIYTNFIASKAPSEKSEQAIDENETLPDDEKGITGFHVDSHGQPFLYDYMIKGFFKDACSMLRRDSDSISAKLKAHKKVIDGLIFVSPRKIKIDFNGGELGTLERSLRAQTAQGERISLSKSQTAPAGSQITFTISVIGSDFGCKSFKNKKTDVVEMMLREWLDYGRLRGIGQWRNAGYGAFAYEMQRIVLSDAEIQLGVEQLNDKHRMT